MPIARTQTVGLLLIALADTITAIVDNVGLAKLTKEDGRKSKELVRSEKSSKHRGQGSKFIFTIASLGQLIFRDTSAYFMEIPVRISFPPKEPVGGEARSTSQTPCVEQDGAAAYHLLAEACLLDALDRATDFL